MMALGHPAEPPKGNGEEGPSYDVNLPYQAADTVAVHDRTEFPQYLPLWDDEVFHGDPPAFDYQDPAGRAVADMPNLLHPGARTKDITPKMGTIVTAVNLKGLSDATKDELALLLTKRKIVVLRNNWTSYK